MADPQDIQREAEISSLMNEAYLFILEHSALDNSKDIAQRDRMFSDMHRLGLVDPSVGETYKWP